MGEVRGALSFSFWELIALTCGAQSVTLLAPIFLTSSDNPKIWRVCRMHSSFFMSILLYNFSSQFLRVDHLPRSQ